MSMFQKLVEKQLLEAVMKPDYKDARTEFARKFYNDKHKTNFSKKDVHAYLNGGGASDEFHDHIEKHENPEHPKHLTQAFGAGADRESWDKLKESDDPCWKGYEQIGMKEKNGKKVPNCVPEESDDLYEEIEAHEVDSGNNEELHAHMHNALMNNYVVEIELGDGSLVNIEPHQIQHMKNKKKLQHLFGSLDSLDDFQKFLDTVYEKSEPTAFHGPDKDNFAGGNTQEIHENHIPVGKKIDTDEGEMKVTKHIGDDKYEMKELKEAARKFINDRISKIEEQQIDEISKKSLVNYVKAAQDDLITSISGDSFNSGKKGDLYNKTPERLSHKKRESGIDLALDKLTRDPKQLKEGEVKLVGREKKQSIVGMGEPMTVHVPGRGPVSGKVVNVGSDHAVVQDSEGNRHRVSLK